ncbi:hypothetical protein ACFE04_028587 [Oxalis oulophora]
MKSSCYCYQHSTIVDRTRTTTLTSGQWMNASLIKRVVGLEKKSFGFNPIISKSIRRYFRVEAAATPFWDAWKPEKSSNPIPLSDIFWPSAGAFAAMALLGKMDQILAPKGVSLTIAPLGAVCAVLFTTPASPAARKYNMFMAQIGCATIGVVALALFGPGWLARSAGLAAAIAFMTITRSTHPPAASLPLLFIDGVKLHHLNYWYALFPGAAACILLCLLVSSFVLQLRFYRLNTWCYNSRLQACPNVSLETDRIPYLFFLAARNSELLDGHCEVLILYTYVNVHHLELISLEGAAYVTRAEVKRSFSLEEEVII